MKEIVKQEIKKVCYRKEHHQTLATNPASLLVTLCLSYYVSVEVSLMTVADKSDCVMMDTLDKNGDW